MEPLTTAVAAFSAVKAGIKIGKDAQSLFKDVAKAWGAIEAVKNSHNKAKNSVKNKLMSVEEEAMETFVAKKQAEDMEKQLREIVLATRGIGGWQELLRMRAEVSRERKEAERQARRKAEEQLEHFLIGIGILFCVLLVAGLIYFVMSAKNLV
jgi:molecular chaperone GrpE (heat shock protein)